MIHTDPDIARKQDRVSRSWKESHGHFAEFEKPDFKAEIASGVLYLCVLFSAAWLLYSVAQTLAYHS